MMTAKIQLHFDIIVTLCFVNPTPYPLPALISLNATDEYRGEMDVIGNFLKKCCVQKPELTIRIRELFRAYQEWCDGNNEHAVSERFFGLHLKEMGYEQGRISEARFWSGLGLLA